ncbi:hypothetical protein [Mycolicibacterium vinylchloridicum]|uniref:hypothetical protein n=1 Tax=Mycolicibacterium vinylchloridicum TaxID=2736928 RepID=UPI0015CDEA21|nr:hypothetical protein [Mycolicibacterium vinylchloridicum]
MTETPEQADEPATSPVATLPPPPYVAPVPVAQRPNRLYQAAAWVAIVAGTVFIVGAVFFTGFALGRHSGDGGWHHRYGGDGNSQQFHHRGGPGMGPGMGPWGPMGPMGPGGPGGPNAGPGFAPGGPGNAGPGATASPTPRP